MQNKHYQLGVFALLCVAAVALFTAVAHMSCIVFGESCYRAQMAPEALIQAAQKGGWEAPLATFIASSLFVICAIYALSAAKLIRSVPLLRLGILTISGLCLLRGVATLPLSLIFPEQVTTFSIVAGVVWFMSGAFCLYGFWAVRSHL